MSDKSAIHWTDASWNPTRGCTRVSAGCDNCYAATLALRFGGPGKPFTGLAERGPDGSPRFTGEVRTAPHLLTLPLRWRAPRRIFVNSMSDLFHVGVPRDFVDQVFAVMTLAERHTFQILTKRPQRMTNYLNDPETPQRVSFQLRHFWQAMHRQDLTFGLRRLAGWPLANVWCGTSVERQRETHRISALLDCRAAVRFLSLEPLLGPLSLAHWLWRSDYVITRGGGPFPVRKPRGLLHWVIVGGESGPHHRPMDLDWARLLRDECIDADVPFFFKQSAGIRPGMRRELDGQRWEEFPAVASVGA